ncbi:hypothetical protein A2Z33_05975 [Candidatus Gottesmanbacteria bacterium RBG_16_52_11]|uniref:GH26 domain-containing protein n=1 Tax=Candidatus Gottesmanbacteria bacterium RBG_16_52_11 TaxID=1798374 RepID=A0A1F5YXA5_9BACT|nr:MAG: hypothetical protein A2Z33_05975 [Candidatus Gottesmanbacteria bacterium RBG_16_52_11]
MTVVVFVFVAAIPVIYWFSGGRGITNRGRSSGVATPTAVPDAVLGEQAASPAPADAANSPSPALTPAPARAVYWGLWTEGFWDDSAKTLHPERLRDMESQIGKKAAIAHYYRGWHELDDSGFLAELNTIAANGWRPMVSANPYFFDGCGSGGKPLYRTIADGNCDGFLKAVGRNFKVFGKPVFFRFAWEMNIPSMEWNIPGTGDAPQDFREAWNRFRQITLEEGATNMIWVFSPHIITSESSSIAALYPGDTAVDWVALDGYNWGTTQSWSSWQSFSEIFTQSYTELTRIAPTKPVMIAEVNTSDRGGDKVAWYTEMLSKSIQDRFSRVVAVVFYDEDRTAGEKVNWRINISQMSIEAFRKAIADPLYRSAF